MREGKGKEVMEIRKSFNMQFVLISLTFFPGSPLLTDPVLGASSTLFLSSLEFSGDTPFLIPSPQVIVLLPDPFKTAAAASFTFGCV